MVTLQNEQHSARPWLHVSDEQSRPHNSTEAIFFFFLQHCKACWNSQVPASEWMCVFFYVNICPTEKTIGQSHAPFFTFECISFCDSAWERGSRSTENLPRIKGLDKPEKKILHIHTEWEYHTANQRLLPFSDQSWFSQTFCRLQTNTSTNQSTSANMSVSHGNTISHGSFNSSVRRFSSPTLYPYSVGGAVPQKLLLFFLDLFVSQIHVRVLSQTFCILVLFIRNPSSDYRVQGVCESRSYQVL